MHTNDITQDSRRTISSRGSICVTGLECDDADKLASLFTIDRWRPRAKVSSDAHAVDPRPCRKGENGSSRRKSDKERQRGRFSPYGSALATNDVREGSQRRLRLNTLDDGLRELGLLSESGEDHRRACEAHAAQAREEELAAGESVAALTACVAASNFSAASEATSQ
eukprot:Opistho-2@45143